MQVVAGVVLDPSCHQVLLAKRHADQHQGGLWEYPGGKCEPDESEPHALARELLEELGIRIRDPELLLVVEHDYPDKWVRLAFYVVTAFDGEPVGCEGQRVEWVTVDALDGIAFPEANRGVRAALDQWRSKN